MALWSNGSQTILPLAYFGHRFTTGLPVDAGLWLYAVPERGGLQGTDRAVTTCRLPLNRGVRGKRWITSSSDTASTLGVTTLVVARHSHQGSTSTRVPPEDGLPNPQTSIGKA